MSHICQVTLSKTQPPLVHSNPLGMFDLPGLQDAIFFKGWFVHTCVVLFFFLNHVHPGRLTWNIQITHFERKMIFQTSMRTCSMLIFQGVSNGRFSSKKRCEKNINQSCNLSFVPGIARDHQRLQAKSLGVFLGAKNKRNQQKQKRKQTSNTRWWQLKYFVFSPKKLGKIPIWTSIFFKGLVQPPTGIEMEHNGALFWIFRLPFWPLPRPKPILPKSEPIKRVANGREVSKHVRPDAVKDGENDVIYGGSLSKHNIIMWMLVVVLMSLWQSI